jgi:hypothetical protein
MSRLSPSIIGSGEAGSLGDKAVVNSSTAAAAVSLNAAEHANRLYVVNAVIITSSKTITLPKAVGSGDKYEILNNAVQTQSLIVAALGTDVFSGTATMVDSVAVAATEVYVFQTTATSDKLTWNITTTGGLRGDWIECYDIAAGTWLVRALCNISGTPATPWSAT